jgi:hypothetical protein
VTVELDLSCTCKFMSELSMAPKVNYPFSDAFQICGLDSAWGKLEAILVSRPKADS